mmetsp:Transcript_44331/g.43020  ORF Transcript_44331/g.43020 Transcript_44331/m.43020 type:complete len:416 (+) Transcript_44331:263-1510(+)
MPIHHKNTLYNCRVICLNQKILLIRPKLNLADGNNYREARWFTPWLKPRAVEEFYLNNTIAQITGQQTTSFGNAVIQCLDTSVGCETCEELWVPHNPHVDYGLDGVEIIANGSGSHHELRKLDYRLGLIQHSTKRNGGVYLYANLQGCDGNRLYFDGSSMIFMNGVPYAQAPQFSADEVRVEIGVLDLDEVRSLRGGNTSRCMQASLHEPLHRVKADISIQRHTNLPLSKNLEKIRTHLPEEEIGFGPAMWMWDYLRRSGARGFFLPLSGGADSASVAALVASMAVLVLQNINQGNHHTLKELRRVVKDPNFFPNKYQDIVGRVLVTSYLGTKNSSDETLDRAKRLATGIGSLHYDIGIDEAYDSIVNVFAKATGKTPQYEANGGQMIEDLSLQNIQARIRMVISYLMAQLVPWT